MQRSDIALQVKGFLEREMPRPGVVLTETTNLLDDWFVDSMQIVQIVMFIETQFGIDIYRADVNGANFKDIETISRFVAQRLAQ